MNKIIIIKPHGFCFGVDRAIKLAQEAAQKYPQSIYLLGEIVHNQFVVDDLEKNFHIKTVNSLDEIPPKSTVIIRAHGAGPQTYLQAKTKDLNIIDATCPFVVQVHLLVKKLIKDNKKIVYLASDYNHDEAQGVFAESPENITLTTIKDIESLNIIDPQNTVVLSQTTLSVNETQKALDFLKNKYPQVTIHPHICAATTERQQAVLEAAKTSDLVIIVGSLTSSNSKRLVEAALTVQSNSYIIESAADLKPEWFSNVDTVAVSSGASTPENIFNEVTERINKF